MKKLLLALVPVAIILLSLVFFLGDAQPIAGPFTNVQLKGWIFGGDAGIAGERTWAKSGTADTLLVSGVDITCVVFLCPKTATGTLRYDVATAGDTVFVTSSGSETATTDKYSYFIIRNGYGATD